MTIRKTPRLDGGGLHPRRAEALGQARPGRRKRAHCQRVHAVIACVSIVLCSAAWAQPTDGGRSARQTAPYDLTGYWVSIVTEDWRWRMMTPPVGDYASVPMTDAARAVADNWDLAADAEQGNQCRPYGAGGIMRIPGRLHISWEDDETLRVDTDAGSQSRFFHFAEREAPNEPTWQGHSEAEWEMVGGRSESFTGGSLKVVTTRAKPGYVRWNGVPYSADAVITEYFDKHDAFGQEWFTVTTVIDDPVYFTERFIVSTHFRKEADGSRWNPTPCVTEPPVVEAGG